MAHRIANTVLNASSMDIMNVIRQNASYEYQSAVPIVEQATDIPKVGEIIYGTPAFSNQFLNALINRIAIVRLQSATFNNPYARMKKGYLEYGETVEDIFVGIAKAVEFDPDKASAREFKRTYPDVKSAFHAMNWRVMYPVTIQDDDLRQAFLSIDGVTDLIAKIIEQVYTGAEYDEFLLFKYLLIKAVSHGNIKPIAISGTDSVKDSAIKFRGTSNLLQFMSSEYTVAGVRTNTPKDRQVIFMDANYNAQFDVEVLASAFNMEKADFMGSLYLIDDFTSFDNERFDVIRAESDGIEEVTADELALMGKVKAIMLDENWFQIYDNLTKMTEKYVSSGLYWNYFYHTWKTVSFSPFANAVSFVDNSASISLPLSVTGKIATKDVSDAGTVFTVIPQFSDPSLAEQNFRFHQTSTLATAGVGVHPYGGVLVPHSKESQSITLEGDINGTKYVAGSAITASTLAVGNTVTLAKQ